MSEWYVQSLVHLFRNLSAEMVGKQLLHKICQVDWRKSSFSAVCDLCNKQLVFYTTFVVMKVNGTDIWWPKPENIELGRTTTSSVTIAQLF